MKKTSLFLAIGLLLSIPSISKGANPIAGAKCSKSGLTQVFENKKYTCTKSGKKLVWNKGQDIAKSNINLDGVLLSNRYVHQGQTFTFDVIIKSTINISKVESKLEIRSRNSVLSFPGALQTGSEANGKWHFSVKVPGDFLAGENSLTLYAKDILGFSKVFDLGTIDVRLGIPNDLPVSPNTNIIINPIRIAAFESVHSYKCGMDHSNFKVTRLVGPNFPATTANKIDDALSKLYGCFNSFFDSNVNLKIFYVTAGDNIFVKSEVNPSINSGDVTHMNEIMDKIKSQYWGSSGSSGGFVNWDNRHTNLTMVIHTTENYPWQDKDNQVVAHEFTHVMQQMYRFKSYENGPNSWYTQIPGYAMEGGANGLSFPFSAQSPDDLNYQMNKIANEMSRGPDSARFRNVATEADMLIRMKELIAPQQDGSYDMQYPIGGLICEYLIGQYGFEKYLQLIKNTGVYKNFDDNLIATYGISQDKLFSESVSYVFSQWRAAIKN